jgi:MGT family glycosyltransferase
MNLFLALADALRSRGHKIAFFNLPELGSRVTERGFRFHPVQSDSASADKLFQMMSQMSTAGAVRSLLIQGEFDRLRYAAILEKASASAKAAQVELFVIDQAEPCSGSVAELLQLPWVSVCCGLSLNSEPDIPPFVTGWRYHGTAWARIRNQLGWKALAIGSRSLANLVNRYRAKWHLPVLRSMDATFSPFAQISQQVAQFDFPRRALPPQFHYVGPIRRKSDVTVCFPWERLDGRPIIYASLGTLVNRHGRLLRRIAQACGGLPYQLVLSLGGGEDVEEYANVPGNPIVVKFAPQMELLKRASITVSHAGLNTTLESLSYGVPLVALPIAFEQPAIAARIEWTGAGKKLNARTATATEIRRAIETVLGNEQYRANARRIGSEIARSGGAERACQIIEQVLQAKAPVLREHASQEQAMVVAHSAGK